MDSGSTVSVFGAKISGSMRPTEIVIFFERLFESAGITSGIAEHWGPNASMAVFDFNKPNGGHKSMGSGAWGDTSFFEHTDEH